MTYDINLPLLAFNVDIPTVEAWVKANAGANYVGASVDYDISLHYTSPPSDAMVAAVQAYWSGLTSSSPEATNFTANAQKAAVATKVAASQKFMNDLLVQFNTENLILGIDADNMVDEVLTVMSPVLVAMQSGSPTSAIKRAKAIPTASYDSKYVTAARLLAYCNKIEAFLGIPLSTSLS